MMQECWKKEIERAVENVKRKKKRSDLVNGSEGSGIELRQERRKRGRKFASGHVGFRRVSERTLRELLEV